MLTEEDFQEINTWFDNYLNSLPEDLDKEDADTLRLSAINTAQKLHDMRNMKK